MPCGSVGKEGPSAGVTIATSLYSTVTKKMVRNEVAMTGELTLRGKVLPVSNENYNLLLNSSLKSD